MKVKILQLLFFLFCSFHLSAQVYVNASATGANDGSSWANAFTDLTDGLAAVESNDEVWVAAGTYTPMANDTASFYINAKIGLYGGFNGTETELNQRDSDANVTILSGDRNGDDIVGNFDQNRTDNSRHIVYVDTTFWADGAATIDGFTISNGESDQVGFAPFTNTRGGGILAVGPVEVNHCIFTQNNGSGGTSIGIIGIFASGSTVNDCEFMFNNAYDQSAGVHIRNANGVGIWDCHFHDNMTNRGVIYPFRSIGIEIGNCIIENNTAAGSNWGGAFYNWNSEFTMTDCQFIGNIGANAGGVYNDGREDVGVSIFENCVFKDNGSTDWGGGAIYNWQGKYELIDCTFEDNIVPNTGGSIYNSTNTQAMITGCDFSGGAGNFGAAMANYGLNCNVTYEDCTFEDNTSNTSAGAVMCGFLANVSFLDCEFEGNEARWGGAIYVQSDSTEVSIDGCSFVENIAENFGGGINVAAGVEMLIENTEFLSNQSNFGGGMSFSEDSLDLAVLEMRNVVFQFNTANTQGAALNLNDADVYVENGLFAFNLVQEGGDASTGGGIAINATDEGVACETELVNCTIATNIATLGAGISQWEESENASATLILQNTIFENNGNDYEVEAGTPTVISNGGNICNDATMNDFLTASNDFANTNPLFVDIAASDYRLQNESPGVDAGTEDGAPTLDLDGNVRIGQVDSGAYENVSSVNVEEVERNALAIQVYPNPVVHEAQISIENTWRGDVQLAIYDVQGRLVLTQHSSKSNAQFTTVVDVSALSSGTYQVLLSNDAGKLAGASLIKL